MYDYVRLSHENFQQLRGIKEGSYLESIGAKDIWTSAGKAEIVFYLGIDKEYVKRSAIYWVEVTINDIYVRYERGLKKSKLSTSLPTVLEEITKTVALVSAYVNENYKVE